MNTHTPCGKTYKITKLFIDGLLEGLRYEEKTIVAFECGRIYSDCVTGERYQIVDIELIAA